MAKKSRLAGKPYKHAKNGHWYVQVSLGSTPDGKRKRKTLSAKTKAAVEAKVSQFLEVHRPHDRTPTGRTLQDWLQEWFEIHEAGWKPRTQELYRHLIDRHITPVIGAIPLEDVTPSDIQKVVNRCTRKGNLRTANQCRGRLYSAMRHAVRFELILRNPVEAINPVPDQPPEMKMWTQTEARRFLSAAEDHRLYPAFVLLIATGMRRGELLGLRWKDVTQMGVRVEQTVVLVKNNPTFGTPKSKSSRRFISLQRDVLDLIETHRQRQRDERRACGRGWHDNDLVFPTKMGTPTHPRNFRRVLDTYIAKTGVPRVSLHSQRHLHTSLLIANDIDAKTISDRVGHSSTSFTLDRYGHIFSEYRSKAALPMSKLLGEEDDTPPGEREENGE